MPLRRLLRKTEERDAPRSSLAGTLLLSPHEIYDPVVPDQSFRLEDERKLARAPEVSPTTEQVRRPLRPAEVGGRRAFASGTDKRLFHPEGKDRASTKYGTEAQLRNNSMFALWSAAYPCIQRTARREVMFATHHAGIGHRRRKRRTYTSEIEC